MKNSYLGFLILPILIFPFVTPVLSQDVSDRIVVDYIFTNSNIISIDDSNPISEAIAISNGNIVAIGNASYILDNYETENNTCYDMEGRTIMPGIIDGHSHYMASLFWIGERYTIYQAQNIALAN